MSSGRRWLQSCIIVALSVGYGSHSPDAGSLLADFIPFLRIPLRVAVFVCWNNEKSVRFARKLLAREHHGQPPHFLQLRNESVDNLSVLDTLEPHQHLAVVDRACPNAGRFLLEAQYRIYHKIRWVILNGDQVEMEHREVEIFEILSSLPITGNSNLFYFVRSVEGKILVKDVYRISMNTGLISSVVAIWQNGTFTDAGISQPVSIRRRNLHRAPIRSTLVYTNNYTLNHFDDYENTQIDTHSRTGYILVKALYDIYLNATMEKRFTASWCYSGSPGLCSDLVDGLSDAGASVMFMRAARLKLVEYIKLPVPAYIRFIYKTPKLSTTDNIFRLPFNSSVWGCTIGLIIFAGGLLLVVSVVQRRIDRKRVDLVDATFDIIPIAMQQGTWADSVSISQRTLVLVTLIGLMFMEVSFSAKIISLIQAPSEKISTLKDLLESKLEVGSEDTPYNRHFLSTATEPVRRALVDQKLKRKNGSLNLYDVPEGIGKIREGLFAFHVYTSTGYKFVGETFEDVEKCSLRELAFLDNSEAYIPVKKNFTLREHFHVGLMRIMEMGIYAREQRKMHFVKPSCTKGVHFQPLNTLDIRFAVQLMAWGVTTAILLLLVEAIWSRCSRASRVPVLPYVE